MSDTASAVPVAPAPRKLESAVAQWRTVFTALALNLSSVALCFFSHPTGETLSKMFNDLCWMNMSLIGFTAGKSAVQHVSAAGGIKSLVGGLLGQKDGAK